MPTFPSTTSYIVFCRHGQRLPSRNLSLENVAAAWDWEKHLFPIIDDATNVEGKAELLNKHAQVCKAFPVHSADQQKYNRSTFESPQFVPHDLAHFPFGSLSTTGAHYMEQQGKELKKRFPGLLHFDRSQFEIFSTNYLRTQTSAQYLLAGLIGLDNSPLPINVGSVAKAKACAATCPMTFYESKDRAVVSVVRDVVKNVQSMSAFLEDEGRLARDTASKNGNHSVAAAKRTMIDAFPEIAKAPNGFDWPLAFDYFTCRRAHDLPVSREVEQAENAILNHFVFRYWSYYRDPEHLANYIQPLLNAVVERLLLQHHPRPIRKNAVTLFSAHDITLFALLMSMGESLRQKGPYTFRDNDVYRQVDTETLYNIWPHFASTLLVEAHSSFDYSDSQLSEPDLRERLLDDVKLRFYYNHKAIMIDPDYFPVQASSYLSQPSGQSLSQVLQNSESLHQQRAQYQLKEISLRQLLYLSKHMHVFLRRE